VQVLRGRNPTKQSPREGGIASAASLPRNDDHLQQNRLSS
jgi:hypothetical protein